MNYRTYYHMMKFGKLTESTADTFLEYIQVGMHSGCLIHSSKNENFPTFLAQLTRGSGNESIKLREEKTS